MLSFVLSGVSYLKGSAYAKQPRALVKVVDKFCKTTDKGLGYYQVCTDGSGRLAEFVDGVATMREKMEVRFHCCATNNHSAVTSIAPDHVHCTGH